MHFVVTDDIMEDAICLKHNCIQFTNATLIKLYFCKRNKNTHLKSISFILLI